MKEEWLLRGAVVPVDVETTAALVAEIHRLIGVVGGMALAQPEQGRFLVATIGNWGRVEWADGVFPSVGDKMYSAQRTWVGLTEWEREAIAVECGAMSADWLVFMKAVEKALEEKNA